MHSYTLVHCRRNTMAIYITNEATVEVRAPLYVYQEIIDNFVAEKSTWIAKRLKQMEQWVVQQKSFVMTYGSTVLCCGSQCTIVEVSGNTIGFEPVKNQFYLPRNLSPEAIQIAVISIYKNLAKGILPPKVAHFSTIMNLYPKAVKISSAKTRWGSCSSRGNVNFSWMLLMAPDSAIDYVVIHELAHLREMNHSPKFWNLVAQYCPNYANQKQSLKSLQLYLSQQKWV